MYKMERFRCFFDVEVDEVPIGRIIFELFNDTCPKTCENFRALCTGELGDGKTTGKSLHYRNVKFHRVIKDFMVQAGDFSAGNGTGGESIYGGHFEDENFDLKHDTPFLLSMANRGKDTNGSQFFITTQTATHLDGKHVVFGRVVDGQEVVVAIETLPVDNRSRPLQQPIISNCGELILQRSGNLKLKEKKKKKKTKAGHVSDSDEEKKKLKKKKKEKKVKKDKLSDGEIPENDETQEVEVKPEIFKPHPLAVVSTIDPEDIPEVPKNRFLDRGYQNREGYPVVANNTQERIVKTKVLSSLFYTRSGRKVKGRGSLRYRTPSRSRSRSRSNTPPHWRQAQARTVTYEKYQRETEIIEEHERNLEDRRMRREERHRLLGLDDDDDDEVNNIRSVVEGNKYGPDDENRVKSIKSDKTNRDWRVARHETTFENKENKSRSNGRATEGPQEQDLRHKLDQYGNKRLQSQYEKRRVAIDEEMDENALDFEVPSDPDENEGVMEEVAAPPAKIVRSRSGGDERRRNQDHHRRNIDSRRERPRQRRTEMARYEPPHRGGGWPAKGDPRAERRDKRDDSRSRSRNRPPRRDRRSSPEQRRKTRKSSPMKSSKRIRKRSGGSSHSD